MFSLRCRFRQVIAADEEFNGTGMISELLGTLILDSRVLRDQQLN
jgi:hypothetical protein